MMGSRMKLQERILGFILGIGIGTAIGFFLRATESRKVFMATPFITLFEAKAK
jgi:hypothetical protein